MVLSFLLVTVLISISNVSPSVFNAITSQQPKPEILSKTKNLKWPSAAHG